MQILLDLPKESVDDLKKAVKILEVVIKNKENGELFSKGLDQFKEQKPAFPEWLTKKPKVGEKVIVEEEPVKSSSVDSPAARTLQEQKKMMGAVDLSSILRKKK